MYAFNQLNNLLSSAEFYSCVIIQAKLRGNSPPAYVTNNILSIFSIKIIRMLLLHPHHFKITLAVMA